MAARRAKTSQTTAKQSKAVQPSKAENDTTNEKTNKELAQEHLPPLFLVFCVLFCSGSLLVLALRDTLATGKTIAGPWDQAMMIFTKSTAWFDDSKGWKSTQGGLSSIARYTSDANNMGGFFVRKMAGTAAVAVYLQKMLPLVVHPHGAEWVKGHFRPLLTIALISNLAIVALYGLYYADIKAADGDAAKMALAIMSILAFESMVLLYYLVQSLRASSPRAPAMAIPEGKTPSSPSSNIVARTVLLVSTVMTVIAARDLLFPGFILDFIPRDDIYLEWTGAFFHSPPAGSEEEADQGLLAPLYVGDKFMHQLMALHILVLCFYKFVSAVWIRYGSDGSGEIKAKMIWKVQALGDAALLFMLRLFAPAAETASLDLRWHLMSLAYETFILGLYGFF